MAHGSVLWRLFCSIAVVGQLSHYVEKHFVARPRDEIVHTYLHHLLLPHLGNNSDIY